MSVGKNIKFLRKQKGLSQSDLGAKVKLSASQISNIESGKRQTTYDNLVTIADGLGCKVADLYDEEDKLHQDNAWILFNERMKKDGIKPEQAERWIKLAKGIIDESD